MNVNDLAESLKKMDSKLDNIATDLTDLKVEKASLPCSRNEVRIKIIERIVYGLVAVTLISVVTGIIRLPKSESKVKALTYAGEIKR